MSNDYITQKVTLYKGQEPEPWTGTDWWTPEQRAKFDAYVEELKRTGEYMKPEEYTLRVHKDLINTLPANDKPLFASHALLMPKGAGRFERINPPKISWFGPHD